MEFESQQDSNYSLLQNPQTGSGDLPAPYSVGSGGCLGALKEAGRDVDFSPHLEPYCARLCASVTWRGTNLAFHQQTALKCIIYLMRRVWLPAHPTATHLDRATVISAALPASLFLSSSSGAQQWQKELGTLTSESILLLQFRYENCSDNMKVHFMFNCTE
jgi:hypothetical protein